MTFPPTPNATLDEITWYLLVHHMRRSMCGGKGTLAADHGQMFSAHPAHGSDLGPSKFRSFHYSSCLLFQTYPFCVDQLQT
nr:hypothetical protein [Ruegeria sp. HKCCD7318]